MWFICKESQAGVYLTNLLACFKPVKCMSFKPVVFINRSACKLVHKHLWPVFVSFSDAYCRALYILYINKAWNVNGKSVQQSSLHLHHSSCVSIIRAAYCQLNQAKPSTPRHLLQLSIYWLSLQIQMFLPSLSLHICQMCWAWWVCLFECGVIPTDRRLKFQCVDFSDI